MSEEKKVIELNDEELEKVSGGGDNDNNPLGLIPGDRVKFYYDIIDQWIWGEFMYYDGVYRVRWDDTTIIYGRGVASFVLEADETEVPESWIRFN